MYIGESKRPLHVHRDEHKNMKDPKSVVSLHMIQYRDHEFYWKNIEIFDREPL